MADPLPRLDGINRVPIADCGDLEMMWIWVVLRDHLVGTESRAEVPVQDNPAGRKPRVLDGGPPAREQACPDDLAPRMDAVGAFAASIAGELDDLLTIFLICLDRLEVRAGPGGQGLPELEDLRKLSRRFSALGRKIAVASLRRSPAIQAFDLAEIVGKAIQVARPKLKPGIVLETSLSPEPTIVRADPAEIVQSVVALLLNARDAMPGGGIIKVATRVEPALPGSDGHDGGSGGGPRAILTVTDDGEGIPAEVMPHLFEPFFTTRPGKADGLGLTVVYSGMKNAGGHVTARSEPGKGASFALAFPLDGKMPRQGATSTPLG